MINIMHCTSCHHEWVSMKEKDTCNWCGCEGYVLASENAMADICNKEFFKELVKIVKLKEKMREVKDAKNKSR